MKNKNYPKKYRYAINLYIKKEIICDVKCSLWRTTSQLRTEHVQDLTAKSAQTLYALRVLRAHGLSDAALQEVYRSVVVARLLYAASAWTASPRQLTVDVLTYYWNVRNVTATVCQTCQLLKNCVIGRLTKLFPSSVTFYTPSRRHHPQRRSTTNGRNPKKFRKSTFSLAPAFTFGTRHIFAGL